MNQLRPIELPANQPEQFYRGGTAIAELRGISSDDETHAEFGPEDWVASTTTRFGQQTEGLSALPDGRWLRDAVREDPNGWLGPEHTAAFGADPALLVKLLDAGQRLPVHCHPSDGFAREHFNSHFGKTEAWIVIGTSGPSPHVYAGFSADIDESTVDTWVSTQDSVAMLGALNPLPVEVGDTVFIPAGLPHSIGSGVFIVELQQPTDLSVTLEWRGFLDTPDEGHLGIGYQTALECVDRSGWDAERLSSLVRHTAGAGTGVTDLLAPESAGFFRADRLCPAPRIELAEGYAVLVVLEGSGTLRAANGTALPLRRGSTVVIPYAAGVCALTGDLVAVRCRPPLPATHPPRVPEES